MALCMDCRWLRSKTMWASKCVNPEYCMPDYVYGGVVEEDAQALRQSTTVNACSPSARGFEPFDAPDAHLGATDE